MPDPMSDDAYFWLNRLELGYTTGVHAKGRSPRPVDHNARRDDEKEMCPDGPSSPPTHSLGQRRRWRIPLPCACTSSLCGDIVLSEGHDGSRPVRREDSIRVHFAGISGVLVSS